MVQLGWRTHDAVDMEQIAAVVARSPWSPCVWRDGDKRNNNFLFADLIALDFDTPEMPLAQAIKTFCDMAHVIGTTKSHGKEKNGVTCDRYRVVMRLERRVESLPDFKETLAFAMRHYPADKACKDGGRFFWPCAEIVSVANEGFTVDVQAAPPIKDYGLSEAQTAGVMPKSAVRLLEGWITVDRHRSIYLAGWDMGLAGWSLIDTVGILKRSPIYDELPARRREFERTIADAWHAGRVKREELAKPVFTSSGGDAES